MRDVLDRPPLDRPIPARRRTWPWAVAALSLVALIVLGAAFVQRRNAAGLRAVAIVPAPSLPPMTVAAIARPEGGAALFALDPAAGRLVALAGPSDAECPPVGACPPSPAPDAFVALDGASGQALASTPLTGDAAPAMGATLLVADAGRHLAYAIAPRAVVVFSTQTAARTGGYGLPAGLDAGGVALDAGKGVLYLADARQVVALDAASGRLLASAALAGAGALVDGPVYDAAHGRLYLLERPADPAAAPTLVALDAHGLRATGQEALPVGVRLGPLDATAAGLYAFGADGTTWRLPLDGGRPGAPAPVPALRDALALGANPALGHQYVVDASGTRLLGAADGRALAALPLPARWAPAAPLPVDAGRGLLYLPADHGAIVIVQDGRGTSADGGGGGLTSSSALLLARAAMAALMHSTYQDPPFVAPATFPAQPGARAIGYWVASAAGGWQGPYTGDARTAIAPLAGRPGGYRVAYTIHWDQLFPRVHTWLCDVSPDGSVSLAAESGDGVP